MKKSILFAGAAALLAGAAIAQPAPGPRADRQADLTREQAVERADRLFDRLDVNRDGRATPDEARQAAEQRRAARAGQHFDRLDANRDGSISRAEFDQARSQRMQRREQRAEHVRERMGERHERRAERAPEARDGERRVFVMRRPPGHGPAMMMRRHRAAMRAQNLFQGQDFVTREQVRERALERFARLDVNRDGTVTAAERMEARPRMRMLHRERAAPPAQRD